MAENSAPIDIDDDDGALILSDRHVSIKRLHELIGVDRNTIKSWIAKGCPVVSKGELGTSYVLDIRAVWKWRESELRRGAGPAEDSKSEASLRWKDEKARANYLVSMAKIAEVAEKRRQIIRVDDAAAAFTRAIGQLRQSVMGIPDRCVRKLAGFPEHTVARARKEMIETCQEALEKASKTLAKALGD